jgi:tyrosinase
MYKQSPSDRLSFFQIAGIHGKPYVQWNNAGPANTDGWRGYCPHGENLFLPWHRPYIMLFEQRLVETATRLAKLYPTRVRAQYEKAARELRSPYWDWASQQAIPTALSATRVRVNAPSGGALQSVEIPNPLRYYNFPKAAINGQFGTFDSRPSIYKCRSPQTFPGSANTALKGRSYKRWTYDALTRSTTFNQFSSTSSNGVSLEQIHNAIHWDASCGNQFLEAEFSAFDPVFMLHHTQVDRLWAYWQAMRPSQASFSGTYRGGSRWQTRSGTTISPDSPLQPFYASAGKFHTSRSVASIRGKGYTYGALEYWRKSDAQMQKDATARINRLYGSGASARMLKRDEDADGHEATRFFAQVEVELEELERPCSINAYVDDKLVGELVVLGQPATGKWYGKFGLDEAPDADPSLDLGKTVGGVVKDLLKSIRLEIIKSDGTNIPVESISSLKLDLENINFIPPETVEDLPEYHDEQHRDAPVEEFLGDSDATTFIKSERPDDE